MKGRTLSDKTYLKVAIPFVLSTVTQPLLGAVDTAVVGHLSNPGYIAGVSVGAVIFNTIYWIFGFLRVSTTGFSAQAGRNEEKKLSALIRPMLIALSAGLFFVLFQKGVFHISMRILSPDIEVLTHARDYFTILIWGAPLVLFNYVVLGWLMGQALLKESMIMQISGNLLNMVLDILFVYGFDLGVRGVATATLISQITSALLGVIFLFKHSHFKKQYLDRIFSYQEMKSMLLDNSNLMLRTLCLLIQINTFTAKSASFGTTVLAVNAILLQMQSVISYMFDGLANASSVFSGKAVGEKNKNLLKETIRCTKLWTTVLMIVTACGYGVMRKPLIAFFTNIPEVLDLAMDYSLWILLYPVLAGFGLTFYGVFTGTTVTKPIRNTTFYSLILYFLTWLIFIPGLQNHGLWLSLLMFYFGRTIFLLPYFGQIWEQIQEGGLNIDIKDKKSDCGVRRDNTRISSH